MTEESISIIVMIIFLAFILLFYLFIPFRMAKKRERSVVGWILLFWIISPLFGIIALLVLGDSRKKLCKDIIEELNNKN